MFKMFKPKTVKGRRKLNIKIQIVLEIKYFVETSSFLIQWDLCKHEYFNNLNCIVSYQIVIAYEVFLITRIRYKHSNKLALNPSVQNLF